MEYKVIDLYRYEDNGKVFELLAIQCGKRSLRFYAGIPFDRENEDITEMMFWLVSTGLRNALEHFNTLCNEGRRFTRFALEIGDVIEKLPRNTPIFS